MNKTKIEWADYTWNPIKGLCPVGCWYCYARKMHTRFGLGKKYFLEGENERLLDDRELWAPRKIKKPSRIFVCSTYEIFHPAADFARDEIFKEIKACHWHTFIILTKYPQNIDRSMPENVWLGVTISGLEDSWRGVRLFNAKAKIKFVSYEPLLSFPLSMPPGGMNWIIIGKLTGHGKKYDPPKRWVENLVDTARALDYPIFLKNNLKEIWGEPLIQELPK